MPKKAAKKVAKTAKVRIEMKPNTIAIADSTYNDRFGTFAPQTMFVITCPFCGHRTNAHRRSFGGSYKRCWKCDALHTPQGSLPPGTKYEDWLFQPKQ